MVRTFSDNKKIYSVDMMFAYLNLFEHPVTKINVVDYASVLEYDRWGDPKKHNYYSPADVLKNPTKKSYKDDFERIQNANLTYPIIIYKNNIVDGVHRLAKASINKKKNLKAYVFDDKLMKKFLIDGNGDWNKVDDIDTYQIIEKFYKQFSG